MMLQQVQTFWCEEETKSVACLCRDGSVPSYDLSRHFSFCVWISNYHPQRPVFVNKSRQTEFFESLVKMSVLTKTEIKTQKPQHKYYKANKEGISLQKKQALLKKQERTRQRHEQYRHKNREATRL